MSASPFFRLGASAEEADPALVASDQAASRLAHAGFDPLRDVARDLEHAHFYLVRALDELGDAI